MSDNNSIKNLIPSHSTLKKWCEYLQPYFSYKIDTLHLEEAVLFDLEYMKNIGVTPADRASLYTSELISSSVRDGLIHAIKEIELDQKKELDKLFKVALVLEKPVDLGGDLWVLKEHYTKMDSQWDKVYNNLLQDKDNLAHDNQRLKEEIGLLKKVARSILEIGKKEKKEGKLIDNVNNYNKLYKF